MSIIRKRRSIRKFKDCKVEEEKVVEIVKSGFCAPSAGNEQPWEFIIVDDRNLLYKLAKISPYWNLLKDCQDAIIVVGNLSREKFEGNWILDLSASTQNLLLEIENQGLGGVWLGVYPEEDRMARVASLVGCDGEVYIPFSIVAFGYKNEVKEEIDRVDESRIHKNRLTNNL